MEKIKRIHNYEYILYYDEKIIQGIINDNDIIYYAYIFHDKDIYDCNDTEDINKVGKLKEPHWHLLVNYKNAKNFDKALSIFKVSGYTTLCIPIFDKIERFEYLTHQNHPSKYQYDKSLIVTNGYNFYTTSESDKTITTINIINDILEKKSLRYMVETYGRDFVINYQKYTNYAMQLDIEENPNKYKPKQSYDIYNECLIHSKTGEIVGRADYTPPKSINQLTFPLLEK